MFFRFLALSSLIVLMSCAYALEKQQQKIYVETPGAENALCYVYVEKLKHKVRPPQHVTVSKSLSDLTIDCMAPGNRRKVQVYEAKLSGKALAEAPLILPLVWDAAAATTHKYPDVITVDFSYTPIQPEKLPAQNRPDVKQPEEYPLEEFMPGRPRLNSDGDEIPFELIPRDRGEAAPAPDLSAPYMVEEGVSTSSKGTLQKATTAGPVVNVNPAGPRSRASEPNTMGPSYPGQ